MPIIYAIVARATVVLAEHATLTGNFASVALQILQKIPSQENSQLTLVYDRYLFHYICKDGIIFMCMADDAFGRRIPFAFLQDIQKRFTTLYGQRAHTAAVYGLNEFHSVLEQQMVSYKKTHNSLFIPQTTRSINSKKCRERLNKSRIS